MAQERDQNACLEAVMTSPIVSDFRGWFAPSDEEIREGLSRGLVAVDTNILLNLYKYEPDGTREWFNALKSLKDRLWIPRQVLVEFWRNRESLAAHAEHTKIARSSVERGRQQIEGGFKKWLSTRATSVASEQLQHLQSLSEVVDELLQMFEESEQRHADRFDSSPSKDEIVRGLSDLVPISGAGARVGKRIEQPELEKLYKEGEVRYGKKIPPGYLDDANTPNAKNRKTGESKFGDWILWAELLAEASSYYQRSEEASRWVVLVTDDSSNDWWQKSVSGGESGSIRIARQELVDEMAVVAGCMYIQLTPRELLTHISGAVSGVSISDSTFKTTKSMEYSREDDSSAWYPGEFVISAHGSVRARSRINKDGTCRVLRGSRAKSGWSPSFQAGTRKLAESLLVEGVLVMDEDDPTADFVFAEDYFFSSPSTGASVVQATNASGNLAWKDEDGKSLGDVREEDAVEVTDEQ